MEGSKSSKKKKKGLGFGTLHDLSFEAEIAKWFLAPLEKGFFRHICMSFLRPAVGTLTSPHLSPSLTCLRSLPDCWCC